MKTFLFIFIAFFGSQKTEYVCTPCGQDCDHHVYDRPGDCDVCGMKLVEKSSVKFKDVTFEEVCKKLKANPGVVLLDVRTPAEFNGSVGSFGHLKNAININVEELQNRIGEISRYKNREVLVYCSHSHRSPRASYILTTNGFKNVKNVAGGVSTITESDKDCLKGNYVSH